MALYIPLARRRRNAVAVAFAALIVGLLVGWLVGRNGAPSVGAKVKAARTALGDTATRLDNLPNEYAKAFAGQQSIKAGVLDALDAARTETQHRLDAAPWVAQKQRDATLDQFAKARDAAAAKVAPPVFAADIAALGATLRAL